MSRGCKPTREQAMILASNGRFPDDFLFVGMKVVQTAHKNQKGNKQSLDKENAKHKIMKFKNRSEGFIIELEA